MASPRLPTQSDFPAPFVLDIVPPSSGSSVNVLILLHGLGDTNKSFTALGKNLNLPETTCLSLQAPSPIPALFTGSDAPSFHWGDDVLFDERRGEIELDAGFDTSLKVLQRTIEILTTQCNYPVRNILLLGFGQGAMAALSLASSAPERELGGVVSIGGALPPSTSSGASPMNRTPVLLCGGTRSTQVTRAAVDRLKGVFRDVEYIKWDRADDGMMRNREEMLPIMRFFARRLRSRAGVPEGAVEV